MLSKVFRLFIVRRKEDVLALLDLRAVEGTSDKPLSLVLQALPSKGLGIRALECGLSRSGRGSNKRPSRHLKIGDTRQIKCPQHEEGVVHAGRRSREKALFIRGYAGAFR